MKLRKVPPLAWVTDRPEWCQPGRKLRVVTDPASPDFGRVAGIVSPRAGSVAYANDPTGQRLAPRLGPSGGAFFHAGERDYDNDGETVGVKVGSICVEGGHSDSIPELALPPYTAEKMDQARDYLQRAGRWQDRHGELVLHGRVTQQPDGVLFLGAAYEWADVNDLELLNSTTLSPEWWQNPAKGNQDEFIGLAKVLRTALPGPDYLEMPMAANLEDGSDPLFVITRQQDPIRAEISPDDLAELREMIESKLTAIEERIDDIEAGLFEHAAQAMRPDDLTTNQQLEGLADEVRRLAEQVEQNHKLDPHADGVASTSGTAPNPLIP